MNANLGPHPNTELLDTMVGLLGDLAGDLVFVGGCATELLVTVARAQSVRVTTDVDVVFNVRDRFDLVRPVIRANSSSELGASLAMTCSSSRLPADRTLANDSVEVTRPLARRRQCAACRAPPPTCEPSSPEGLRCHLQSGHGINPLCATGDMPALQPHA